MIRNYLRGGQNVDDMERHEQAIRAAAETRVGARLRFRPLRRAVFSFVLSTCRWGIKTRENLRLARSRSFGVVKRIYRAIGRHFTDRELIDGEDDVFFLTIEEVAATCRGNSVTRDLKALIALRKAEYERFRPRSLSPRVVTHGIVYTNRFERELANSEGEKVLHGIACSPGQITAPIKVVLTPSSDLRIDGEILVAAATDPGWVFLMVASGGLISEKGSVLSHTAIIGRELGIPTVVGVRDATARLLDGEIVELNGDAGQVVRKS
jgi:pyruvate,water dikinase